MTGPIMVVGRETTLPSGGVDLVGLARSGELLVVEFKTGPQNTDFRHVVDQLLDYGSDLWQLSYEEFESTVAIRYFGSSRCQDGRLRGKASIVDAALTVWPDLADDDLTTLREHLVHQLKRGSFSYVVVAQRFTSTVERTVEYLKASMHGARFYAVELVKFAAGGLAAFESRTVVKPERIRGNGSGPSIDEVRFLEALTSSEYRDTLREHLGTCRGLNLRFEWGSVGTSIRVPTSDRAEPLTIGWLFPSDRGAMGLRDLTFGFSTKSAQTTPSVYDALNAYAEDVAAIPGAETVATKNLRAYRLRPHAVIDGQTLIKDVLAKLVQRVNDLDSSIKSGE